MNNVSNWVIGTAALIVISVTLLSACSDKGATTTAGEAANEAVGAAQESVNAATAAASDAIDNAVEAADAEH